VPVLLHQVDRVVFAVDVAGEVLDRPAQPEQGLLEGAAFGGMHDDRGVVDPGTEFALGALGAQHLLEHRSVQGVQDQAVGGMGDQLQPPVAIHGVGDVDQQGVRHRVAGVVHECGDHALRVEPGCACVPQAQVGQPIGVDVFGCALEFCEGGDRRPGIGRCRVVDLQ
jgi:hypothetical protein